MSMKQLAKDIQKTLKAIAGVGTYERNPPRDAAGVVTAEMPFLVYTAAAHSPQDERGEWQVDLFLDVWSVDGWEGCYDISEKLDAGLDGTVIEVESGVLFCDRNGLVMNREERDPEDERIRRMSGQYLLRWYPKAN